MDITKEDIAKWLDEVGIKCPYTKYLGNGLWEVFDGKSSCYMGQKLYEQYCDLLKEAVKNLKP